MSNKSSLKITLFFALYEAWFMWFKILQYRWWDVSGHLRRGSSQNNVLAKRWLCQWYLLTVHLSPLRWFCWNFLNHVWGEFWFSCWDWTIKPRIGFFVQFTYSNICWEIKNLFPSLLENKISRFYFLASWKINFLHISPS